MTVWKAEAEEGSIAVAAIFHSLSPRPAPDFPQKIEYAVTPPKPDLSKARNSGTLTLPSNMLPLTMSVQMKQRLDKKGEVQFSGASQFHEGDGLTYELVWPL